MRISENRLSRPRTLKHPGRPNPVRIQSENARRARHVRLLLEPGRSMFEAIVVALRDAEIENASLTILGGMFERLEYCVAPPDPNRRTVVAYSKPIAAGRSLLIFGNATLGESMEKKPLVHCHGVVRTENGDIRGGHIMSENCLVGARPISALVTSFRGVKLRQSFDRETNMALMQPAREQADG